MASLPSAAAGASTSTPALSRAERNARTTALIAKLNEADDSLALILDLAAQAIDTLQPAAASSPAQGQGQDGAQEGASASATGDEARHAQFESSTTDYFALLNDVQLFLRSAVYHLVHSAKRAPLTPAQTANAFDALRAATAAKGHALRPRDVGGEADPSTQGISAAASQADGGESTRAEDKGKRIDGLPDDALLSLGALRLQHQAWSDLATALEAMQ